MAIEKDRTLAALKGAIQMEIEGRAYYLQASEECSNEAGKKLLRQLASEEDIHLQKCEKIYEAIQGGKTWPNLRDAPGKVSVPGTLFREAADNLSAPESEFDSVRIAIEMENKTYDFYQKQARAATSRAERRFYEALTAEENKHKLVLLDYDEYLKDPASWFVNREHPSLDGGY
ncbi:MAG: ferritin family protein [Chloroflexota bacterium]